jgi:filamentous hemagglutinin family protein
MTKISPRYPRRTTLAVMVSHALAGAFLPQAHALDPAALPAGGTVVGGAATIRATGPARLDIQQHTGRAAIDWQSFNIGSAAHVNFAQPSASSVALNRVLAGGGASTILGKLTSNGQVFLVNPQGVLFGSSAQVNVGGLVASTLDISSADFMSGRASFSRNGAAGAVVNQGSLQAADGGYIALLAPEVRNEGVVSARLGTVAMAAGERVTLDFQGDRLISLAVDPGAVSATIENRHLVQAQGGMVLMSAQAAGDLASSVVNNSGLVQAGRLTERGGVVRLEASTLVANTGTIDASGDAGGSISVGGKNVLLAGALRADGAQGDAGSVRVAASRRILQTAADVASASSAGGVGGAVLLEGGFDAEGAGQFLSGRTLATGATGGSIHITGAELTLAGASLDASGARAGGTILVGGGYQGRDPALRNADSVRVNGASRLDVSARESGDAGTAVLWSEKQTTFTGAIAARGGASGGDGGLVEVSSRGALGFAGAVDAGANEAAGGRPGKLLLDPKNIVITETASSDGLLELVDPNPGEKNGFGSTLTPLSSGTIVVTSPGDDFAAKDAGAAYVFNTSTGALVSTLTGTYAGDAIGSGGVLGGTNLGFKKGQIAGSGELLGGNFFVLSNGWNGGRGAITWGSGSAGVSGAVNASNSLVGSAAGEMAFLNFVGLYRSTLDRQPQLTGSVVLANQFWNESRGAATLLTGERFVGELSSSNSLVGTTPGDRVGEFVVPLAGGAYVVGSTRWDSGRGAYTFGSVNGGVKGEVSASNSLVGSARDGSIGSVVQLNDGRQGTGAYVVTSPSWGGGRGAVTFGSASTGVVGEVGPAISLVGSAVGDGVGGSVQTTLDGGYVVLASSWNGYRGAVAYGSPAVPLLGEVSASNALVGTNPNDMVGSHGVTALYTFDTGGTQRATGKLVVNSPNWSSRRGAVTFAPSGSALNGEVGETNSLVGSATGDSVGSQGVVPLGDGSYAVLSMGWNGSRGAVTFGHANSGAIGAISAANSLIGSQQGDNVGYGGLTELYAFENGVQRPTGSVVIRSPYWGSGRGALTFLSVGTGSSGEVSAANSLVGSDSQLNSVGWNGTLLTLASGGYLFINSQWNGNRGAVTWGSPTAGVVGEISAANSLVGSTPGDSIGRSWWNVYNNKGITPSVVFGASNWNGGRGAVTFIDGTRGVTGEVSAANSLVGTRAGDFVGESVLVHAVSESYFVHSPSWNDSRGAVTRGSTATGVAGEVSASNSLVGTAVGDRVGSSWVQPLYRIGADGGTLYTGDYVYTSPEWNGGRGAVTFGGGGALVGEITAANSLIGTLAGDRVGSRGIAPITATGGYLVLSPEWNKGRGAATYGTPANPALGEISAQNSLVGTRESSLDPTGQRVIPGDSVGSNWATELWMVDANAIWRPTGSFVVSSHAWNEGRGALTQARAVDGLRGEISASNSLVGAEPGAALGSYGVNTLNNGDYLATAYSPVDRTFSTVYVGPQGRVGTVDLASGIKSAFRPWPTTWLEFSDPRFTALGFLDAEQSGHANSGRVFIAGPGATLDNTHYTDLPDGTRTISPSAITAVTNTGTAVVLQASNDITVRSAINTTTLMDGGDLTLQAGRSVILNAGIRSGNGDVTLIANDHPQNGVVEAHREAGAATISMAQGATIDAGNGQVNVHIRGGFPNSAIGWIDARGIRGGAVSLRNEGMAGSGIVFRGNVVGSTVTAVALNGEIRLDSGARLAGTGLGSSIVLAGASFLNEAGGTALDGGKEGRWLVYSATPERDARGGLAFDFKRYGRRYSSDAVVEESGDGFLYSISPVITVTPGASRSTYGDTPTTNRGYQLSGFIDGDTQADVAGAAGFHNEATHSNGAGSYEVRYEGRLTSTLGYRFIDDKGSFREHQVDRAVLTVTTDSQARAYGDPNPVLTGRIAGFKLADDERALAAVPEYSTGATQASNVGDYSIKSSGGSAANYDLIHQPSGVLSIKPATLTVTVDDYKRLYGATNPELTGRIEGFKLGESAKVLGAQPAYATIASQGSDVGTYGITASGGKAQNYAFQYVDGKLSVSPAPLRIVADDAIRSAGQANPMFSAQVEGLVLGQSLGDLGTLDLTTTATAASPGGTYPIVPGGLATRNYEIAYVDGKLTVLAVPQAPTASRSLQSAIGSATQAGGSGNANSGAGSGTGGTGGGAGNATGNLNALEAPAAGGNRGGNPGGADVTLRIPLGNGSNILVVSTGLRLPPGLNNDLQGQ